MEISFFLGAQGPQQQSSTNMGEGPSIPEETENMATETTQSEYRMKNNRIKRTEQYQTLGQFKRTIEFVTRVPKGRLQILEEIMDEKFPDLLMQKL